MIDIQAKRTEGKGAGYTRWAGGFNLKQMVASLNMYTENKFSSLVEVDELVSAAQKELRDSLAKVKAIESVIEEKKELRTHLLNYWQSKTVRQEYKAMKPGKKRDAYYREHESELLLSKAAEKFFKEHGISSPLPQRKNLQAEIERLISEKNVLYEDYRDKKKRADELVTVKHNLEQMVGKQAKKQERHDVVQI